MTDLGRGGTLVDVAAAAGLEHPPFAHDQDFIGQHRRLLRVVGDQDGGEVDLALEAAQFTPQFGPDRGVQRGERLVEQHHPRVPGQRPGQADPLALPTGELLRQPVEQAVEVECLQPPGGPARVRVDAEYRLLPDRAPGDQAEALRDVAEPAPLGHGAARVDTAVGDGPGVRPEQPGQDPQRDRLPRS
jgi:hypothetical protein